MKRKCKIEFRTDNQAFDDYPSEEIKRILLEIVGRIEKGHTEGTVFDINGNSVGEWRF